MLGKNAQYDECKVYIDGMAYADSEEQYEHNWAVIQSKYQFAVSYVETQSAICGCTHGRIRISIMGLRRTLWPSHRMRHI
jgi:hypothetical protein